MFSTFFFNLLFFYLVITTSQDQETSRLAEGMQNAMTLVETERNNATL